MASYRLGWWNVLIDGLVLVGLTMSVAEAARESSVSHTLPAVPGLALEHTPAIAGVQGLPQQSRGQQVAAGAYLNPLLSGSTGPGSIRDPSSGVRIMERMVAIEQPLEWQGKRRARQQAADAGVEGATAAMDETRLTVIAETTVSFYQVLLAQRDMELAGRHLTMMEEVFRVFETGLLTQAEQTLRIARISFQQGAASLLDVLDAHRVYRQTAFEYVHARADLSIAPARLEHAVGGF